MVKKGLPEKVALKQGPDWPAVERSGEEYLWTEGTENNHGKGQAWGHQETE